MRFLTSLATLCPAAASRRPHRRPNLRVATAAAAAVMLAAGPAAADLFGEWDADRSGAVSVEEFGQGAVESGVYNEWDADGDGLLADEELNAGLGDAVIYDDASSRVWDLNDDGRLDRDEFREGYHRTYDADHDAELDEEEFGRFERESGWFE